MSPIIMTRSYLVASLFIVLAALAFFAPTVQAAPTNVTACQVISTSGVYQFNQSVNGTSGACVDISAGNVELDCQGNLLFGNLTASSIGIRAGPANNVTLYNCQIKNFSVGIRIRSSSNVTLRNNSIWNNTQNGIELTNEGAGRGNTTHVFNNTVSYSGSYNIKSVDLDDSELYNNRLYTASSHGMLMQSGTRNNVTNNTIWNNTDFGIRTDTSENVTYLFNNTIHNNSGGGMYLTGSRNSIVYLNTLYNNTGYGIFLQSGLNGNASYNTLYNQSSTAIRADTRENATEINYNTVHTNYGGGIYAGEAYLTNIRFNTLYNNTGIGIYTQASTYINITNNTVHNVTNGQPGIRGDYLGLNYSRIETNNLYNTGGIGVLGTSTNTTIRDNTILNSSGVGIFLQDYVQNVTVFKNTITNFTSTGILVYDYSHDNYILNNTLTNATGTDGIGVTQAGQRNIIQYNNVSFVYAGTGINLDNASDNAVSFNRVINSTNLGIRIGTYAHRNTVQRNTMANLSSNPISIQTMSQNNTVLQNTISFTYNDGNAAIRINNASNNNVTSNVVYNVTGGIGIETYSNGNRLENNSVENLTGGRGISIGGQSENNTAYLNNVSWSYGLQGIELNNASYNNVSYNRVTNLTATGIQAITLSTYNTITDNFVTGQSGGGTSAYQVYNSSFNTFYRNVANFTQAGYFVGTYAMNNTLENNSAYRVTDQGIKIDAYSANNTVRRNTLINHTNTAIYLNTLAHDNYVLNNTLTNGSNTGPITGYGIFITGNASNNFIDYNNVSFDQANALVLSNASYNTIRYNRFFNSTIQSAYLDVLSSYNTLLGNLFENASHRLLEVSNASYNTFENNTFRLGQRVQLTLNATNNTFTNNTLEFMPDLALEINLLSHNNSFRQNLLLNNSGTGFFIDRSSLDSYFYSNLVSNATGRAVHVESSGRAWFYGDTYRDTGGSQNEHVYVYNATSVNFTNVTISSALGISHFFLNTSSSVVLLNATFNKSRVLLSDSLSNLTVRWYVFPFAFNLSSGVFPGIVVNVKNLTATNESDVNVSGTSVSDGSAPRITLTEYFQTSAYTNNYSSYNFSAYNPYTRLTNSSTLIVTSSGNYSVFISNDTTAPSVSLVSPVDSAALTSFSGLTFSFSDAVSSTANCTVYLDGVSVYNNASVLNGTSTSISLSASYGTHNWNASCLDAALNQGNSSLFSFSLSSGTGSSSSAAATPAATATATPVPTVVPVSVTVEPTAEPSVEPETPVATVEPVEEVVVPVEEVTSTTEPVVLESGAATGEGVIVTTSFSVSRVTAPSGGVSSVSRVLVTTKNIGTFTLRDLQVTREFKFLECLGPDPAAYEAVGVVFSPRPFRIECGSAVVTWLFDNVEPGQEVNAEAKVPKELTREQVQEGVAAPRVVARAAEAAKATARPSVTAAASVTPTPGGFDWTLPALGVLVLLGVGAYFVFGRKTQGL